MKNSFDYLIVGAGWFGAVAANQLTAKGKSCLVIDRREQIGGNCYTENIAGINVHKYGAHIFHTSNKQVWDYVCQFAEFNRYTNSPMANYKGEMYNLPFNMNTFRALWGIATPEQAEAKIKGQRKHFTSPKNLEEQALALVGTDIYEKLIKGYTEKQWGRSCSELPAFIIRRIPLRFTYDNNYFNDLYQGIPIGGYTNIFKKLLANTEVRLRTPFRNGEFNAGTVIYTGAIDSYFDYIFGALEYRSLRFESTILDCGNYQGNAVVNFTDQATPYTRVIEHKHFEFGRQPQSVITMEYPAVWQKGGEQYYPVNDEKNTSLYNQYQALARARHNVIFGGRLGTYRYLDMDRVIFDALQLAKELSA